MLKTTCNRQVIKKQSNRQVIKKQIQTDKFDIYGNNVDADILEKIQIICK